MAIVTCAAAPAAAKPLDRGPDRAFRTPVYHARAVTSTASISRTRLCARLAKLLHRGGSASGVFVEDASAGRRVCRTAGGRARTLASNTKLFTTATAMAKFGPDHQFETEIWRDGTVDQSGVLHGDLYLVGGGDPTLSDPGFADRYMGGSGADLPDLAADVDRAGIKRVTGQLIADDTIFDRLRGVRYSNYGLTSEIGPLSGLDYNLGYAGNSTSAGYAGDPAREAAQALGAEIRASGIRLPHAVGLQKLPAKGTEKIGSVQSPTLDRIVDQTDTYSINFYAEMLEKGIGARFGGTGSTAAGALVVSRYASQVGSGIHAVDGSGLTHSNTASPAQVVALLDAVRKSDFGDTFTNDLALAGREGTVADRMRGTAAEGRCRTKTGTLNGVSALSGYCFNRSGKTMIFSILNNGVGSITNAHVQQDKMAALIARY